MKEDREITDYLLSKRQKTYQPIDIMILVFVSLYLFVDNITLSNIQDQLGIHWLILAVLNLIGGVFLFKYQKDIFLPSTKSIFTNIVAILYLVFFTICGISMFVAINKVEGLIIYSRLCLAVISFIILAILFYKRLFLLDKIAIIVSVIVLIKSFHAIKLFYSGLGKVNLDVLVNSLQSSEGNKNIFAAALVVQIPFMIYGLFVHKKWLKYLCAVSLGFAFMTIFLINARSAYLGMLLELVLVLLGFGYLFYKEQQTKHLLTNFAFIAVAFLGAFFISQNAISKALQKDKTSVYGSFDERMSTITDESNATTSIRVEYWKHAFKIVERNPLIGVGIGNWKLYTPTYTNTLINDNVFSKHPHNDFLEIAGESGIPNSIIYFLIFASAFFVTLRILFSKRNQETKLISLILFIALSGYFVDAFFNFPFERPHMQILFVFILALFIANYGNEKQSETQSFATNKGKIVALIITLFSLGGVYGHYTILKSMKSQFIIDNDLNSVMNSDAMPQYRYAEVKSMFPSFPNIAENSETIGLKEAKYLRKEKKYAEAIKLLDSVHKYSPHTIYDYYLKCNIYKDQGKVDSAYAYGKKAFYAKPRNLSYYRMAIYLATDTKDTTEIKKMFKLYDTYRKDAEAYSYYIKCLGWSDYDYKKLRKMVEDGLKLYPKDPELIKLQGYLGK